MKALVIGGAGFVGGYLVSELNACGWEVHGTALEGETLAEGYIGHTLNILDRDSIRPLIDEIMPDRKLKGDFACYVALFLSLEQR